MSTEQILTTANGLVEYLRSFGDDDREQGIRAAENIQRTLTLFTTEPEAAPAALSYDVGGKGLLDWRWSDTHRTKLEAFSDELLALLRATRNASTQ